MSLWVVLEGIWIWSETVNIACYQMRLLVWRVVNKTLKFCVTFLINFLLTATRRERLPAVGLSFLAHFHAWDWSGQVESQIVPRPLQSFFPSLFSLLMTVKLKPEIISSGDLELIVNLTILETWDQTWASYLRCARQATSNVNRLWSDSNPFQNDS